MDTNVSMTNSNDMEILKLTTAKKRSMSTPLSDCAPAKIGMFAPLLSPHLLEITDAKVEDIEANTAIIAKPAPKSSTQHIALSACELLTKDLQSHAQNSKHHQETSLER